MRSAEDDLLIKQLIREKEKAEEGNQAKLDFLANMSHELRNSLNGILGMTQILSMRNLPADTQDYVRDIYQSGNHLLTLVSDMLDFAKLEAGQLIIASEPLNVRKLISDVVHHLSKQCEMRNLDLFVDYCDNIPRQIIGDSHRLHQIILNLVTNAMKFTLSGHILVAVEILNQTEDTILLQFIIEDTGIGIPENKIHEVFNRFTQMGNQSAETRTKGSGLGLAIVKQLVEKMGGSIGVNSQVGHGATFWVNLPFKLQDPQLETHAWKSRFPNLKILVVDDNAKRAKVTLKQIFGGKNRAVKGKLTLDALRSAVAQQEPYDIILIDDQVDIQAPFDELLDAIILDKKINHVMICGLIQERNRGMYAKQCFHEIVKPLNPSVFANDLALAWERWQVDLDVKATQKEILPKVVNVLLVEDNLMSQKVANIMLQEFGCHVSLAESGVEALTKLQHEKFDIIFLDIGLPDINGCELAKKIIATIGENQHTPLIALTAHALEEDKKAFLQAGMVDVLIKPITFDSTRSILLKWTDKKNELPSFS